MTIKFIDSHCHLDRLQLTDGANLHDLISSTYQAGIDHMLCVCINLQQFPILEELNQRYPFVSITAGEHPNEKEPTHIDLDLLLDLARKESVVAVGETGLDYYYVNPPADWQQQRFIQHIQVAREVNKPLIIHTRDAREDTIRIMQEERAEDCGGVMHCFTENWSMAKQALDLGFYISFSGIVTFKSAEELRVVAERVPMDRLLIETDSPYLAPVPHRGKSNQPLFVKYVAEKIAELKGLSIEQVAQQTSENYYRLFGKSNAHTH